MMSWGQSIEMALSKTWTALTGRPIPTYKVNK